MLCVQFEENYQRDNGHNCNTKMHSTAHNRRKNLPMRCRPENIAMHLFPAILVAQISFHLIQISILRVPLIIPSKRSHQNHTNQTYQKNHHHKAIEDREPMNSVLEELVVEVLFVAVAEFRVRLSPSNLNGER